MVHMMLSNSMTECFFKVLYSCSQQVVGYPYKLYMIYDQSKLGYVVLRKAKLYEASNIKGMSQFHPKFLHFDAQVVYEMRPSNKSTSNIYED